MRLTGRLESKGGSSVNWTASAVMLVLSGLLASAVHAQAGRAESFVLNGMIVLSEAGDGIAWLQEPALTRTAVVAVRRGESVGAYRLTQVLEDRVELEGPGGKVLIPLYSTGRAAVASAVAGSPAPVTPAPAAAAPAVTTPVVAAPGRAAARGLADALTGAAGRVEAAARRPDTSPGAALGTQRLRETLQKAEEAPAVAPPPLRNSENMIYFPVGDPRRRQGLNLLPH